MTTVELTKPSTSEPPATRLDWCGGRLCDTAPLNQQCVICASRLAKHEGTDAATILKALAPIVRLHTRRAEPIKEIDCWEGACEHDEADGPCPVLATAFCGHCADHPDPDDDCADDDCGVLVGEKAYWPCETLRQIEAIFAMRIERIGPRVHQALTT